MAFPARSHMSDEVLYELWEGMKGKRSNKVKRLFIENSKLAERLSTLYDEIMLTHAGLMYIWAEEDNPQIQRAFESIPELNEFDEWQEDWKYLYLKPDPKTSGDYVKDRWSKCILCNKKIPDYHQNSHIIMRKFTDEKGPYLRKFGASIANIIPLHYDCHKKVDHHGWRDEREKRRLYSAVGRLHDRNLKLIDWFERDKKNMRWVERKLIKIRTELTTMGKELDGIKADHYDEVERMKEELDENYHRDLDRAILKRIRERMK